MYHNKNDIYKCKITEKTYCLRHLKEYPIKYMDNGMNYRCVVRFSDHVYSFTGAGGVFGNQAEIIGCNKDGTPRYFDRERYNLSRGLKVIIRDIFPKLLFTKQVRNNYFSYMTIPYNEKAYEIYVKVKLNKKSNRYSIDIKSAYIRTETNPTHEENKERLLSNGVCFYDLFGG